MISFAITPNGTRAARPLARSWQCTVHRRCGAARVRSLRVRAGGLQDLLNNLGSPINQGKKAVAKMAAGAYDEAKIRSTIEKYIEENPVVVFSWTGCPFCKKAKALLDEVGAKYTPVELDLIPEGPAIRAELAEMTDRTSVPNIFVKGQNIGGCNDGPGVVTLQNQGKLIPLLQAAGAL